MLTLACLCLALRLFPPMGLQAQTQGRSSSTASPAPTAWPQPESTRRVQDVKFFSKTLQREMRYRVILPRDYFTTEFAIPFSTLCTATPGITAALKRTPISLAIWTATSSSRLHRRRELLVVNSATNPKEKWEDYFLHDMLSDAQERFRINGGDARAIAGISSGGYAAINLALKYPGCSFLPAA